jgi:hypothetical protein
MSHSGAFEVEQQSLAVIHDPATGRIVHMHFVETMKGGVHPSQATIEADAHEQLKRGQPGLTTKTAVLHVDPRTVRPGIAYAVDTKKSVLVELKKQRP